MCKPNVLFVEDNKDLHGAYKRALEACGVNVYSAFDVPGAIDAYNMHRDSLNVVVADFGLPDTCGEEGNALRFLDHIRCQGDQVRIVGMSACPDGVRLLKQHGHEAVEEKKFLLGLLEREGILPRALAA